MRPPLDLAIFTEEPAAAPAAGPPVQSGASPVNEYFPGSRFDPGSEEQATARVPGIPGLPGSISQDRLRVEPEPGADGGAAETQFRAAGPGLKPADRRTLAALAGVRGFDQDETRAMLEACQAGAELATGERIGAAEALACWQAIAAEHAEAIAARLEVEQAERARRRCDSCLPPAPLGLCEPPSRRTAGRLGCVQSCGEAAAGPRGELRRLVRVGGVAAGPSWGLHRGAKRRGIATAPEWLGSNHSIG